MDAVQSFDVWDYVAGIPVPVWLGYVMREYTENQGWMWGSYRAHGYGHLSAGTNGVSLGAHDTPDDAQQALRDYWEE